MFVGFGELGVEQKLPNALIQVSLQKSLKIRWKGEPKRFKVRVRDLVRELISYEQAHFNRSIVRDRLMEHNKNDEQLGQLAFHEGTLIAMQHSHRMARAMQYQS